MKEQVIGQNIRRLREEAKITLTLLANKAELTKSALSKIETGQISPPISTLLRIANGLNVSIMDFFEEEQKEPVFEFTPKSKGQIISRNGSQFGYAYEALAIHKKNKNVEPFLITIKPSDPPGEFFHNGQEFVYMLSGQMEFIIGEEKLTLKPGDSLFFDSGHKHKTKIIGKKPVKFLCLFIETNKNVK